MLVAIPAVFFLLAWLAATVRVGPRQGFVVATVVATAGLVAATELLSLAAWLRLPAVLAFWLGATAVAALWLSRRDERALCRRRWRGLRRGLGRTWALGRPELVGLGLVLATVLLVGLVSPPNNWESMGYRMMRAAMWLQHGSVAHYATLYFPQLYHPPLGSYQIAHLLILGGGDRFANVPEWLALAGCALAASLLARELKQGARVQLVAAVVAATLPMALLQGSSTQGNLIAAYWVLCFVLLLAQHLHRPALWRLACCGCAAGFAVLAKPTAYIVVPVAAVALGLYGAVARRQPRRALVALAAAAAIATVANLGLYARNWQVFGHPASPATTPNHFNERLDLTVLTSNLLRNSLVHWTLPDPAFAKAVLDAVSAAVGGIPEPAAATIGPTLAEWGLPYRIRETETPNFLHHWLLVTAAIGLLIQAARGRGIPPPLLNYLLAGWLGAIVAFSAALQWEYWNSRYHVMLFMLGAPLAAVFLGRVLRRRGGGAAAPSLRNWRLRAVSLALLAAAVPWLLFKQSAPLLPSPLASALPTTPIFSRSRAEGYFSHIGGRPVYESYAALADEIVAQQADVVGIEFELPWIQFSYPLAALVKERRKDVEFVYYDVPLTFAYYGGTSSGAFERGRPPDVVVKYDGRRLWLAYPP